MENNFLQEDEVAEKESSGKISYDPNSVFKSDKVSYFGAYITVKNKYDEFTNAKGKKKWINSLMVVFIFLIIEAVIIANNDVAKDFVCEFFKIRK